MPGFHFFGSEGPKRTNTRSWANNSPSSDIVQSAAKYTDSHRLVSPLLTVLQYPTAMSAWGMMAPAAPAEPEPAPVVDDEMDDDFPAMGAVVMKTKTGNVEDEYRCVLMWPSVWSVHVLWSFCGSF